MEGLHADVNRVNVEEVLEGWKLLTPLLPGGQYPFQHKGVGLLQEAFIHTCVFSKSFRHKINRRWAVLATEVQTAGSKRSYFDEVGGGLEVRKVDRLEGSDVFDIIQLPWYMTCFYD